MIYSLEILEFLLATTILFTPIINTLLYPLKKTETIILITYIFFSYFITNKIIPNDFNMAFFTIGGTILIICLFTKNNKFYNIGSAIAGYLVMVCLNYLVLICLINFDVTPQMITDNMMNLIVFEIVFFVFVYTITYLLGKGLRILMEKIDVLKKKSVKYFIITNLFCCLIIFLLFIIFGRITGFNEVIVKQNGYVFFILAAGVVVVISGVIKFCSKK